MGMLYMLDGDNGFVKRFFPMQFHQIQAQVAVADIVGGPNLEIIVADMGGTTLVNQVLRLYFLEPSDTSFLQPSHPAGTLAAVDFDGEVLWDVQCSGTFPHTPTIGDVDGDGVLDVVAVAAASDGSSHLWVVRGDTGKPLPGYPKALPAGTVNT